MTHTISHPLALAAGVALLGLTACASEPPAKAEPVAAVEEPTQVEDPCDPNDVTACADMAWALIEAGESEHGLELLRTGCEKHDSAPLCFYYAHALQTAEGPEASIAPLERACELGSLTACASLGGYATWGMFVEEDWARALELNGRACNEMKPLGEDDPNLDLQQNRVGQVMGCANLAHQYENAKGVEEDLARGFELWSWACDHSEIQAANGCSQVGYFYWKGMSVEASPEQALEYSIRGCEVGEGMGCCNAAHLIAKTPELEGPKSAEELHARATELNYSRCAPLP